MKTRRPNTGSAFVIQRWATFNQPHSVLSHTFTHAETQSTCPRSIQLMIKTKQTKLEMCFHVCLQLKIAPTSSENAVTQQGITPCWSCGKLHTKVFTIFTTPPKTWVHSCIETQLRCSAHPQRCFFQLLQVGCSELHQALCALRRMIKKNVLQN